MIFCTLILSFFRKGATLTPQKVLEIYSLKNAGRDKRLGASIARKYGVTSKAIRDIWNGSTWSDLTSGKNIRDNASRFHTGSSMVRVTTVHRHFARHEIRFSQMLIIE
jgi:hypothetical protein